MVEDIRAVHGRISNVSWNRVFRDANQVENGIAKQALSFTKGYHVFESAPDCISSALRVDLAHILSARVS